jgi:hypothetical protein
MLSQNKSARNWLAWMMAIAAFWLSGNLVVDLLVMPVMYVSGMTTQADFATAGYSLFWSFNRLELVCAAILLTSILALRRRPGQFEVCQSGSRCRWMLGLGVALLTLTLVDTYILTPEMGALAISLDALQDNGIVAPTMNWMHGAYWSFEVLKLAGLACLARLCYPDLRDRVVASSHPGAIV